MRRIDEPELDLTNADEILKDFGQEDIKDNPILRVLNGEGLADIASRYSEEEIHKAYRNLAMLYHPDKQKANNLFILIGDVRLRLCSTEHIVPTAIDVELDYPDYDSLYDDPSEIERYAAFSMDVDTPVWDLMTGKAEGSYCVGRAYRTKVRDSNPDLGEVEMAIAYGVTKDIDLNSFHTWINTVAFRHLHPFLDVEPPYWQPVDRSEKELFGVSTSVIRGREGGVFLIPTVFAPSYQETTLGRLDRIVDIYTGDEESEALMNLPTDLVPVEEAIQHFEHLLFPGRGFRPWAHINQNQLTHIHQEFEYRYLTSDEKPRLE